MAQRPGFTLVEVTIVILISGMISSVLYMAFRNIMQSREHIMAQSVFITRFPLIYNQLARDITGMYVPEPAIEDMFRNGDQDQQQQDQAEAQRKHELAAETAFVLVYDGDRFSYMSGITVNPMTLENTPNRVRFIYRLIQDEEEETATLYRYQVADLSRSPDDIIQQQEGVALLSGITNMSVTVYIPEQQEEQRNGANQQPQKDQAQGEQKQESQGQQQQPVCYITLEQWPEETQHDKPRHVIPSYVNVQLRGLDAYGREFDEAYTFDVAAFNGINATYEQYQQKQQEQQNGQKQQGEQQEGEGAEQRHKQEAHNQTLQQSRTQRSARQEVRIQPVPETIADKG